MQEDDGAFSMNHIFTGGHLFASGVEIERDGRVETGSLRAQTGTCQGGKNRYCGYLFMAIHTLLLFFFPGLSRPGH
jgi:hypothetical protein